MEENVYYVYVYLDPRRPGNYEYGEYKFDYEPFYVGKGKGFRAYDHLWESKERTIKYYKIKKIKETVGKEILKKLILIYEDNLKEKDALGLEMKMIISIGTIFDTTGPLTNIDKNGFPAGNKKKSLEYRKQQSINRQGEKNPCAKLTNKEAIELFNDLRPINEILKEEKYKHLNYGLLYELRRGNFYSEITGGGFSNSYKEILNEKEKLKQKKELEKENMNKITKEEVLSIFYDCSDSKIISEKFKISIKDVLKIKKGLIFNEITNYFENRVRAKVNNGVFSCFKIITKDDTDLISEILNSKLSAPKLSKKINVSRHMIFKIRKNKGL